MATLFVVGTPIGNLEDITLRALRVLREVDMILCEDTRKTKILLDKYEIKKTILSYHSHSKLSKVEKIISLIASGRNLALVSDAGTPTISDPGSALISEIKRALPEVDIKAIPGPSALTAALSVAGVPASNFVFYGFLPHKKGRNKILEEAALAKRTSVFYESTHRILKTLETLSIIARDRRITVVKELTKIYECVLQGNALEILEKFRLDEKIRKGEFVIIISG